MNYVGREPAPSGVILVGDTNPVGTIVWGHKVPDGSYLQLSGQIVSKTTYADLWAYAGSFLTTDQTANPGLYRSIDASTFALPKLDGLFIRSTGQFDANRVAAAVGVRQDDIFKSHTHPQDPSTNLFVGGGTGDGGSPVRITGGTTGATGGVETRPTNVALVPSVKALSTVLMPSLGMPALSRVFIGETVFTATSTLTLNWTSILGNANLVSIDVEAVGLTAVTNAVSWIRFLSSAGTAFTTNYAFAYSVNHSGNSTIAGYAQAASAQIDFNSTLAADDGADFNVHFPINPLTRFPRMTFSGFLGGASGNFQYHGSASNRFAVQRPGGIQFLWSLGENFSGGVVRAWANYKT